MGRIDSNTQEETLIFSPRRWQAPLELTAWICTATGVAKAFEISIVAQDKTRATQNVGNKPTNHSASLRSIVCSNTTCCSCSCKLYSMTYPPCST